MSTDDEYLRYADECMASARQAQTDAQRKTFLDMARSWVLAAAKLKGRNADLALLDDPGTGAVDFAEPVHLPQPIWRSAQMCDKCDELDATIEQYRKLVDADSGRLAVEGIAGRVEELEAQKVAPIPSKSLSSRRQKS